MILYHGSNVDIAQIDLSRARKGTDFGPGFYLNANKSQALKMGVRTSNLLGGQPVISAFEFDESILPQATGLSIKTFEDYTHEWAEFIAASRNGEEKHWRQYDIIEGGVANDKIFDTVELYLSGDITQEKALERLAFHVPSHQICLLNQEIIDKHLTFIEARIL